MKAIKNNPMTTATILLSFACLASAVTSALPPEYAVPASAFVFAVGAIGRSIVMAKQQGVSVAEVLADVPPAPRHPDTPSTTELAGE